MRSRAHTAILHIGECTGFMASQLERQLSGKNEPRPELLSDALFIVLHLVDRLAFASLSLSDRELFMNALLQEVKRQTPGLDLGAGYNETNRRLGKFRRLAAREGEGFSGTLFWEAGKELAIKYDETNADMRLLFPLIVGESFKILQDALHSAEVLPLDNPRRDSQAR